MDQLVQNIIPYLIIYKYLAIFIISYLAAFIVPIPSGSILMAAAAFASIGYFNITLIILISIIANILGDNTGYWISRLYGQKIFRILGLGFIFRLNKYKIVEQKFIKHPGFIIFISRFEVVSTLLVNFISGIWNVSYYKYLKHVIPGTILQVLLYSMLGYLFGYNLQLLSSLMGQISLSIVFILTLLLITFRKKIFSHNTKD